MSEEEELRKQVHEGRQLCKELLALFEARMKVSDPDFEKRICPGSLVERARNFIRGET